MSGKFYICRHCGNLVGMIHDSRVPMMCCGQKMEVLKPGDDPNVTFSPDDDKAVAVYSCCNLHGLWMTKV